MDLRSSAGRLVALSVYDAFRLNQAYTDHVHEFYFLEGFSGVKGLDVAGLTLSNLIKKDPHI